MVDFVSKKASPCDTQGEDIPSSTVVVPDEGEMTEKHEVKENLAADESLRESSMSCAVLSAMSFDTGLESPISSSAAMKISVVPSLHEPVPVSSASSTCTRDSDAGALSDAEVVIAHGNFVAAGRLNPPKQPATTPSPVLHRAVSEKLNAKFSSQKTSRQGRSAQRWLTKNNENIRLVTGAVPILRGGKILFVSSRRKPEWIIPKGGWERDESMEESAIRECYEEAGVFGVLGPKLSEVQYETRKAKKRRLEMETMERGYRSEGDAKSKADEGDVSSSDEKPAAVEGPALLSPQDIARIREHVDSGDEKHQQDDKGSVASATYSQVRMCLFPLYVHKVLEEWPESGRFRKAVDIDTAIGMLESRPELKAVLLEVKERGLHHLPESEATRVK